MLLTITTLENSDEFALDIHTHDLAYSKQVVTVTIIITCNACPELERSGFHEVLPVFSILSVFPC